MLSWDLLDREAARVIWDVNLRRLSGSTPFQCFAWGGYQAELGWVPYYFVGRDDAGEIRSMCLALLRRYPLGFGVLSCIGGPVGDITSWDAGFREFVRHSTGVRHLYFRFRCDRERTGADVLALRAEGWSRSIFSLTSSLTMELDLTQPTEQIRAGIWPRWQKNLRKVEKCGLVVRRVSEPNVDRVCQIFNALECRKGLPPLFSREKMEHLFNSVRDELIFLQCEDTNGSVIAIRAALRCGTFASDYLAATDDEGLRARASYLLLWRLIQACKESGVERYDLGGIDPIANPGVFDFKRWTGARSVEALGEWDWATSYWLQIAGNWAIKRRHDSKSTVAALSKLIPGPRPLETDRTLDSSFRAS